MKYIRKFRNINIYESNENEDKYNDATKELLHLMSDEIHLVRDNSTVESKKLYSNHNFKKISFNKFKELIDAGADINAQDWNYGPLLSMCIYRHDFDMMKWLIEYGADVNATNSIGVTSLYCAAAFNIIEMAKYLIDNGANVNIANDSDVLPIHTALHSRHFDIATLLLKHGSDLKCASSDLNRWMKKDYKFQKELAELYPEELTKIDIEKIHKKILKEYDYIFNAAKYNL